MDNPIRVRDSRHTRTMTWRGLLDAAADLAWGGRCAGCGRPGPVCCPACAEVVRAQPPQPVPVADLAGVWARGDYAGELRALILACKERQGLGLVPLLTELAVGSTAAVLQERWRTGLVVLIPIPSSRATVAARGFDLTWLVARGIARRLRGLGIDVRARRGLALASGTRDQVGLGVVDRASNRQHSLRALPGEPADVVLVDDIITTGATVRAAAGALTCAGHRLLGAGVIAATPRRDGHRPISLQAQN